MMHSVNYYTPGMINGEIFRIWIEKSKFDSAVVDFLSANNKQKVVAKAYMTAEYNGGYIGIGINMFLNLQYLSSSVNRTSEENKFLARLGFPNGLWHTLVENYRLSYNTHNLFVFSMVKQDWTEVEYALESITKEFRFRDYRLRDKVTGKDVNCYDFPKNNNPVGMRSIGFQAMPGGTIYDTRKLAECATYNNCSHILVRAAGLPANAVNEPNDPREIIKNLNEYTESLTKDLDNIREVFIKE